MTTIVQKAEDRTRAERIWIYKQLNKFFFIKKNIHLIHIQIKNINLLKCLPLDKAA